MFKSHDSIDLEGLLSGTTKKIFKTKTAGLNPAVATVICSWESKKAKLATISGWEVQHTVSPLSVTATLTIHGCLPLMVLELELKKEETHVSLLPLCLVSVI